MSALAYHELTDQLPRAVWMAIGTRDWMPKAGRPAMRIVRFTDALLTDDVMTVHIEIVPVKVFGVAKTIADCFRHRRKVGPTVALGGSAGGAPAAEGEPRRDCAACGARRRRHGGSPVS